MTSIQAGPTLPATLAARPRDRRGLPIPYVQALTSDGEPDFTAIDANKAIAAADKHRCGLCGTMLGYWAAFVGGPSAAEHGSFLDPPMHVECAEAALRLCPHMAVQGLARARKHKAGDVHTSVGFIEEKPTVWCLFITRGWRCALRDGDDYVFLADQAKSTIRRFVYVDGLLTEESLTR